METAPIIGVERHRLSTDGKGVTTLVGFWGCPLQCQYCLNPQSWKIKPTRFLTVKELYDKVVIDQLYFLATGGGITFGGGEPLLYPTFLKEFRELCGPEWNITLETSLNVPFKNLEEALPVANHFIVDIKEMNDTIYQRYTGKSNRQAMENLCWLLKHTDSNNIYVRVPLIAEYNTEEDQKKSIIRLQELGITNIDTFSYRKDINKLLNPE